MKNKIGNIIFISTAVFLLGFFVKGNLDGNILRYQNDYRIERGGPFESSNSTSRYALTQAMVEEKTFLLNEKLAKFASPDVVEYKGKYFSIFTPGVSLLGVPFYLLGRNMGLPQLFTYSSTLLFALLSTLLIVKISTKLGIGYYPSLLSGFCFLFATDALAYSLSYTQHLASTCLLLLALYLALQPRSFMNNFWFAVLLGLGLLLDIPNLIIFFPLAVHFFLKNIGLQKIQERVSLTLSLKVAALVVGLLPLIFFFAYYNRFLTGSYFKIGQTIGRSMQFAETDRLTNNTADISQQEEKFALNTRNLVNGLYILLLGNERGWFFYSPIVIFGLLGLAILFQEEKSKAAAHLITALVTVIILTYAMFHDPWGGWSFGPRYLIPASALACLTLGKAVEKFKDKLFFRISAFLLLAYSLAVSVLGALTSNAVPPKIEAINLVDPAPYTFLYNYRLLVMGIKSSLFYNLFLRQTFSYVQYTVLVIFLLLSVSAWIFRLACGKVSHKNL